MKSEKARMAKRELCEEGASYDYYEWSVILRSQAHENKNGITIKGASDEFVSIQERVHELLNKKGAKFRVNDVQFLVIDNARNKPFKIEIATKAGKSPKINVKFYTVNKQGQATIMVTKTSDSDFDDVKVFVFDVIMYLLDGLIDKELSDESLEKMKSSLDFKKSVDDELSCKVCGKNSKRGLD